MSGTNTTPESTTTKWGPAVISVFAMVIFVVAIGIAWWTHDASLPILLGAASANATTACGFWLGSSSSSREKDKTIAVNAAAGNSQP